MMLALILALGVSVSAANVKLNQSKAIISISKTIQLKVTGNKKGTKVKWKSSNNKIASVSSNGKVTGTKNGKKADKTDALRAYNYLRNKSYGAWWIDIYSSSYSVYGTKVGMTMTEAKNKLKAKGWKVIGDFNYTKIRVSRLEKGRWIVFFYVDKTRGNRITSISYYNYHPSPSF